MRRNLEKTIERGGKLASVNPRKDITAQELQALADAYTEDAAELGERTALINALTSAYLLGLATDPKPPRRAS